MRVNVQQLHELKNHEIYPWFLKTRLKVYFNSRNTPQKIPLLFLDLQALKERIKNEILNDEDLEVLLYGPINHALGNPVYSGWTLARLKSVAHATGFVLEDEGEFSLPKGEAHRCFRQVSVIPDSQFTFAKFMKMWACHLEQKIWDGRKKFRKRSGNLRKFIFDSGDRRQKKREQYTNKNVRLNLGAGDEFHEGYLRVDWAGIQDIKDNIISLGRFAHGEVSEIYSNHVLEHIPAGTPIKQMLTRWLEVLKPGAVVKVRIPDAKQAVLHLGERWLEATAASINYFNLPNYLTREVEHHGILDEQSCIQCVYGWSQSTAHLWDMSNQHKSLWTPALARRRFEAAGFVVKTAENLGDLNTVVIAVKA